MSSGWYPVECEHGYDHCPICDAPPTPMTRMWAGATLPDDLGPKREANGIALARHLRGADPRPREQG